MKHLLIAFWLVSLLQGFGMAPDLPGKVIGWGANPSGEATGIPSAGPTINTTGIVQVAGADILAASASEGFSLGLKANHTVYGWGDNSLGQAVGRTNANDLRTHGSVFVGGQMLSNVVSMAAGNGFGVACKSDGTVVTWGKAPAGKAISSVGGRFIRRMEIPVVDPAIGKTTGTNFMDFPEPDITAGRSLKVNQMADGSLALSTEDGSLVPLTNVVAVAARGFFALALKNDGTVVSWTSDSRRSSRLPTGLSNVVAITCGGTLRERSMALKKDGSVVVWKSSVPFVEEVPSDATNAVAIAAGQNHSLVLKRDGTVFGWGFNGDGQATGVPTDAKPDSTGFASGLVTVNGKMLDDVIAIAAHDRYSLALKKDGSVVGWGRSCPPIPAGLTNISRISAGPWFCLAIQPVHKQQR